MSDSAIQPGLAYSAMTESDLDEVILAETDLHAFPWSRGNFTDSLASGYAAWLARIGGELVGYAVVMPVVDEAHLLDISILKPWQGRGLGAEFLEFLFHRSRDEGMNAMLLEVRPSNGAALALYRQAGFRKVGLRKGYYPAPQGREDALVLARQL